MEGRMTHHPLWNNNNNSTSGIYISASPIPISRTAKSQLSRPWVSVKRPSFTFRFGGSPMEDPLTSSSSSSTTVSPRKNLTTSNHMRHVESMAKLPSGAGKITRLNAVILGEALASEEDDLVFPSENFSRQAHVSSLQKVPLLASSSFLQSIYLVL